MTCGAAMPVAHTTCARASGHGGKHSSSKSLESRRDRMARQRASHVQHREDPILGIERLCFDCHDWWPEDREFWYLDTHGKVMGRCRACWVDFNRARRAKRVDSTALTAGELDAERQVRRERDRIRKAKVLQQSDRREAELARQREKQARYYERNRERIKAVQRDRYAAKKAAA